MRSSHSTQLSRHYVNLTLTCSMILILALLVSGCGKKHVASETEPPSPSVDPSSATLDTEPQPVDQVPALVEESDTTVTEMMTQEETQAGEPIEPTEPSASEPTDPAASDPVDIAPLQTESTSEKMPPGEMDRQLAELVVPPEWFDEVTVDYDTAHPWEEARLEIRRLLGLGGEDARRGIKLTWFYLQKDDIGNGHEYPLNLFLGGQRVWAVQAHRDFIQRMIDDPDSTPEIRAFLNLESLYQYFGEYDQAQATLQQAMEYLPDPPWRIAREAEIHDAFGDLYAETGDIEQAKQHYAEAIRLYPTSTQPYGRHLLQRQAAKVQTKLELLDKESLKDATFRDGAYKTKALGYSGDVDVTMKIEGGKIADIQITHQEKIDMGAHEIVPQRIIDLQSLDVDGITGATVTSDAIIDGVYQALKKARAN